MQKTLSNKVFTVSELSFAIKAEIENKFKLIYVKGEISNFKKHSSGHIYFSLKDKDSQISAALFRGRASNIKKIPKNGDQVILFGEISVYPPRGSYQIIVRQINFLGIGELLLKLHALKEELREKGYFDEKLKKPLPKFPKKIGVVTSETGAVIQDILNVLKRRFYNFHLILNPVKVQGETAALEIKKAIDEFNKYNLVDVLIIGRGGGSLEDLFAFNEKIVAESIFNSKIPIISAVGHETDTSISDLVADVRAPTPSAAAEMVISEKKAFLKNLKNLENQITLVVKNLIKFYKNGLKHFLKKNILNDPYALLANPFQKLDEIKSKINVSIKYLLNTKKNLYISYQKQLIAQNPKNSLKLLKQELLSLSKRLDLSIENKLLFLKKTLNSIKRKNLEEKVLEIIKTKKENLKKLISHLKSIDPKNLLKKGFTILFSEKDDSIILSSKSVFKDQKIYALLYDGKIKLKVEKIYGKK
jgi:exodeoxyribonuclease VII large subunit